MPVISMIPSARNLRRSRCLATPTLRAAATTQPAPQPTKRRTPQRPDLERLRLKAHRRPSAPVRWQAPPSPTLNLGRSIRNRSRPRAASRPVTHMKTHMPTDHCSKTVGRLRSVYVLVPTTNEKRPKVEPPVDQAETTRRLTNHVRPMSVAQVLAYSQPIQTGQGQSVSLDRFTSSDGER